MMNIFCSKKSVNLRWLLLFYIVALSWHAFLRIVRVVCSGSWSSAIILRLIIAGKTYKRTKKTRQTLPDIPINTFVVDSLIVNVRACHAFCSIQTNSNKIYAKEIVSRTHALSVNIFAIESPSCYQLTCYLLCTVSHRYGRTRA